MSRVPVPASPGARRSIGVLVAGWAVLIASCAVGSDAALPTPSSPPSPPPVGSITVDLAPPDLDGAFAAVFDRPAGAIERRVRYAYGTMGAERVSVVRWDTTGGTVRSWLEVDEQMRWYPELRDRIEELTAADEEVRLDAAEMRELLDRARDGSVGLLDGVALHPDGDGWWRGTDDRDGPVTVAVRVVDDTVAHLTTERVILDASGRDEWRVID